MQLKAQLGLRGSGLRNGVKPFTAVRRAPTVARRAAEEEAAAAPAEEAAAPAEEPAVEAAAVIAESFSFNFTE